MNKFTGIIQSIISIFNENRLFKYFQKNLILLQFIFNAPFIWLILYESLYKKCQIDVFYWEKRGRRITNDSLVMSNKYDSCSIVSSYIVPIWIFHLPLIYFFLLSGHVQFTRQHSRILFKPWHNDFPSVFGGRTGPQSEDLVLWPIPFWACQQLFYKLLF